MCFVLILEQTVNVSQFLIGFDELDDVFTARY